ncbi:MAG: TonB-dependent receptor [Sphingomonas bacterium]
MAQVAPATPTDAPAQTAADGVEPAGANAAAQDIVVTAQFRETKLQDTPLAITAVNVAMLEQRGQTDISQVAAQAPNVTLKPQPQGSGTGLIAFIRGVGQTDFNYALEPGVGIYIDDVYIPTLSSSLLDLMDLERVEILRGPQGTLAGKNSIGGAIKLFSSKPDGTGKGSIQATYGSFNRIDVRGYADFAIADNLFARISGATKNQKGYVTLLDYGVTHPGSNVPSNNNPGRNGVLGRLGGQNFAAGRLSLRWMPTSSIEVNLAGDYTSENSDAGAEVLLRSNYAATTPDGIPFLKGVNGAAIPADCRFVPNGANSCDTLSSSLGFDRRFVSYANFLDARTPTTQAPFKPYAATPGNKFQGWGVQSNVSVDLSASLKAVWIASYRHYDSTWGSDPDATPIPIQQLNQTLNHRAWSQELRLNGKLLNGLLDYTLGGFYFNQAGSLQARVDLNYAGIDFIHGPDTTPSTSKAVFFNGTFHLTDALNVSGGIRQSWDEKTYTYFRSNPDGTVPLAGPGAPPACEFFIGAPVASPSPTSVGNSPNCLLVGLYNVSAAFKGKRTDWRVAVDYRFSDALMVYGQVATGFKGGGVNPRPFFGPSAGDCSALPAGVTAPCNQVKSFKPETLTTYELGFKSDLFDRRLRVNGAFFWNRYNDMILTLSACPGRPCALPANVGKSEVKGVELEVTARPFDGLTLDGSFSYLDFQYKSTGASGVPLNGITPYTPKWTYSFGVQYDHELASGKASARFDGSYQSSVFTDALNAPASRVDSRFLGNASLRYTTGDKNWQVSLEVQNLFNKYYMVSVGDQPSVNQVLGQPGRPRTWAVTVKRSF